MYCSNCKREVNDGKFCKFCGNSLTNKNQKDKLKTIYSILSVLYILYLVIIIPILFCMLDKDIEGLLFLFFGPPFMFICCIPTILSLVFINKRNKNKASNIVVLVMNIISPFFFFNSFMLNLIGVDIFISNIFLIVISIVLIILSIINLKKERSK